MKETPSRHSYLVAGSKPWSRQVFDEIICRLPGQWHFVGAKADLTAKFVRAIAPRYIFFLHWSWKVPAEIIHQAECICFHMTDVPYGRGGSPLQNLILRGHHETKVSALRMCDELDAGPVYCKDPLSLEGNAADIYLRANRVAARMIERICREQPQPVPQMGEAVIFKRRKLEESRISGALSLGTLSDFIRMLDAEDYPKAFLEHGGFRYEFDRARLTPDHIEARVLISPIAPSNP